MNYKYADLSIRRWFARGWFRFATQLGLPRNATSKQMRVNWRASQALRKHTEMNAPNGKDHA